MASEALATRILHNLILSRGELDILLTGLEIGLAARHGAPIQAADHRTPADRLRALEAEHGPGVVIRALRGAIDEIQASRDGGAST